MFMASVSIGAFYSLSEAQNTKKNKPIMLPNVWTAMLAPFVLRIMAGLSLIPNNLPMLSLTSEL